MPEKETKAFLHFLNSVSVYRSATRKTQRTGNYSCHFRLPMEVKIRKVTPCPPTIAQQKMNRQIKPPTSLSRRTLAKPFSPPDQRVTTPLPLAPAQQKSNQTLRKTASVTSTPPLQRTPTQPRVQQTKNRTHPSPKRNPSPIPQLHPRRSALAKGNCSQVEGPIAQQLEPETHNFTTLR
jgi:hypothetical protein